MDTKKLVVGQEVRMQSGSLLREVTVTDITEEYIEVKPVSLDQDEMPWMIRFQKDGKQFSVKELVKRTGSGHIDWKDLGNLGVYDWRCGGWDRLDPRPMAGEAGFPWELVDGIC
jgi:hypothetical protein